MPSSRRQDFVLGTVVLALVALLLGTVMFIYPTFGGELRPLVVEFDHVAGISPVKKGSPVLLSGALQVGKVLAVERQARTDSDGNATLVIIVYAEIARDLTLYRDCRIATDQPPVGGSGQLVILTVGTRPTGELQDEDVIDGQPAQSFANAIASLSRRLLQPEGVLDKIEQMVDGSAEGSLLYKLLASMDDINAMTTSLRGELNAEDERNLLRKVHRIVDSINDATAAVMAQTQVADGASAVAKLHVLLDHLDNGLGEAAALLTETRPDIRETVSNVERISTTLEADVLWRLRAELNPDDPESMSGKMHQGMDRMLTALENVRVMSDTGRRTLAASKPSIEHMINNALRMSEQLKLTADEVRVAPWRLMKQPTVREKEEMDAFTAARTFAEAAASLEEAAARLEAIVEDAAATGSASGSDEIAAILAALREAFSRFETAEKFLWEQMK